MGLMLSKGLQKLSSGPSSNRRSSQKPGEAPRPSSPPRGLANILRSPSLTGEFHAFLQDLDLEAEEDQLRQNWLQFVIRCRDLKDMLDANADGNNNKQRLQVFLKRIGNEFFNGTDSSKRVSLSSPVLWTRCQALCSKSKSGRDLSPLWKAHDDVIKRLDDIHQPFLLQRYDERNGGNVLADAVQCLL